MLSAVVVSSGQLAGVARLYTLGGRMFACNHDRVELMGLLGSNIV